MLEVFIELISYNSSDQPLIVFLSCENHREIKFIIRRVDLIYLREDKVKHSFQDILNSICNFDVEFLLTTFSTFPCIIVKDILSCALLKNIDSIWLDLTKTVLIKMFLFGICSVDAPTHTQVPNAAIEYI